MRILAAIAHWRSFSECSQEFTFLRDFTTSSAAVDDPAPVKWALIHTRNASIGRHEDEDDKTSFALDDQTVIQQGAREFATAAVSIVTAARASNGRSFPKVLIRIPRT